MNPTSAQPMEGKDALAYVALQFGAHHALLVSTILAKPDFLEEIIASLSAEIEAMIAPFAPQVELLVTIPGVDQRVAEALMAEIGVDMGQFGSAERLASWAGMCPGNHESAGKQRSGRTRKGPKWLGIHLSEAAKAAGRSKGTYLGARYQQLRGRRGAAKATKAVGHSMRPGVCGELADGFTRDLWFTMAGDPSLRIGAFRSK